MPSGRLIVEVWQTLQRKQRGRMALERAQLLGASTPLQLVPAERAHRSKTPRHQEDVCACRIGNLWADVHEPLEDRDVPGADSVVVEAEAAIEASLLKTRAIAGPVAEGSSLRILSFWEYLIKVPSESVERIQCGHVRAVGENTKPARPDCLRISARRLCHVRMTGNTTVRAVL
eukprot:734396-Prymnesium_polylepis.2